jgi:hypothetical protein
MDDTRITTEVELDAALASQRERKIEKLRRQAGLGYFWVLLSPAVAIACFAIAYTTDRKSFFLTGIGVLFFSMLFGSFQALEQRKAAAAELAAMLENRT